MRPSTLLKCGIGIAIVVAMLNVGLMALYYAQCHDTDSLMRYVESVMKGEVSEVRTNGTPLSSYNPNNREGYSELDHVDVELHRRFVLHDFSKGVIYVNYSQKGVDRSGRILFGSWRIDSQWIIVKSANGTWEVVKIIEAP